MAANKLPDDALLDDLCTRFILNVPAEELTYASKQSFFHLGIEGVRRQTRRCRTVLALLMSARGSSLPLLSAGLLKSSCFWWSKLTGSIWYGSLLRPNWLC